MKLPLVLQFFLSIYSVLQAAPESLQPMPHPEAEEAMAGINLERDFGKQLKFHSREIVTMASNNQVPGMNGLMFMRWRGDAPKTEITASVQWFQHRSDLLNFYAVSVNRGEFQLGEINGEIIWVIGEHGFSWTDGEHFLVSIIGSPPPSLKMLNAWLASVPSNVAKIENAKSPNSVERIR